MMKRIAVYSRRINDKNIAVVVELFKKIAALECIPVVYQSLYTQINKHIQLPSKFTVFNTHEEVASCNFLISIGGDGTLLDTIAFIRDSGTPVIGFNIGKLGFLANTTLNDIEPVINRILDNDYAIDQRSLISAIYQNMPKNVIRFALNDITLHKSDVSSMIRINAYVDDFFLNSYWADGLIISTPTGSTAYSMSCGGPIIAPDSNTLIVTPVASHNLTVRPIVISDKSTIRLEVNTLNNPYIVSLDSRKIKFKKETDFFIRKEAFSFNLIKIPDCDFFSTIRKKLLWGHDMRN